ncbi:COG6 [Symbiodinium natans]|uniref:COG6 protein n=1 Tax=Symbiodinium natans TaxID=878477 RepID=A0A812RQP2_9DINO|nr:COG6 [Symbiodinium natans]
MGQVACCELAIAAPRRVNEAEGATSATSAPCAAPPVQMLESLESKLLKEGLTWSDLERVERAEREELLRELGLHAYLAHLPSVTLQEGNLRRLKEPKGPKGPKEPKGPKGPQEPKGPMCQAALSARCSDTRATAEGLEPSEAEQDHGQKRWQTLPANLSKLTEETNHTSSTNADEGVTREVAEVSCGASTKDVPERRNPNHKTLMQTQQGMKFRPWKPPSIVLPD